MLGLESVGPYMQAKQTRSSDDWSSVALDPEGKKIQDDMTRKFQVCFLKRFVSLCKLNSNLFLSFCLCEGQKLCWRFPQTN